VYKVDLIDIGSVEDYAVVIKHALASCDGILAVYAINDARSMTGMCSILKQKLDEVYFAQGSISSSNNNNSFKPTVPASSVAELPIVFVGNKVDLKPFVEPSEVVTIDQVKAHLTSLFFAAAAPSGSDDAWPFTHVETSARYAHGIDTAVIEMIKQWELKRGLQQKQSKNKKCSIS